MNSRIASDERLHFRDRLISALRKANVPVRASTVANEFNLRADGATVTTHAVRKWLAGDAIPTHERLLILAGWLGVHAVWLLYGDAENTEFLQEQNRPSLATAELMLVRDFNRLSSTGQQILREILDVLIATLPSEKLASNGRSKKR